MRPKIDSRLQNGGLLVVYVATLAISASHIYEAATKYGQPEWVAILYTIMIDIGAISAGIGIRNDPKNWWYRTAFVFCLAISMAANVMSADPLILNRIVAGIPPVLLMLLTEAYMRSHHSAKRKKPAAPKPEPAPAKPISILVDTTPAPNPPKPLAQDLETAISSKLAEDPTITQSDLAAHVGKSTKTIQRSQAWKNHNKQGAAA